MTEKTERVQVLNTDGEEIDFEDAVFYMDDDLREELHMKLATCKEQEFFDEYLKAHKEKYGEDFQPLG